MVVIDAIDEAVDYLKQGYLIAKAPMDFSGMEKEHLVAGILMGFSKEVWWYVLITEKGDRVCGLVKKKLL